MTHPATTPLNATALQLLATAERLFAENGIAGVSLRQIGTAAGSANSSAVNYHFGTKDRLIEAIFAYRLPHLLERRALLKERVDPDDLRARLEAHLLPVLELAESPGNSYVSFVEQLQRGADSWRLFATQPDIRQSREEFLVDVRRLLPDIGEPTLAIRVGQVQNLSLNAAAERERAINRQQKVIPFGLFVTTTLDGFTGFLTAPVSSETRRFLARPPTTVTPEPAQQTAPH
ncbi:MULTISPECIES: TetR/AcrR family transcriptional regulator [Pseudofrankia]|uniref:TetR/AcrR family transcriptional regulator n=1 Tax=Pseudofrankia TaxID=2994363 RepID=UPI000234D642|nr:MULTISPECIES: TetR/AcrR family transcriptional regulator [Pseudofrankia]OHV30920.1 TetR family transcriptional regulator [Pseudofrankia sp. EUN1h]